MECLLVYRDDSRSIVHVFRTVGIKSRFKQFKILGKRFVEVLVTLGIRGLAVRFEIPDNILSWCSAPFNVTLDYRQLLYTMPHTIFRHKDCIYSHLNICFHNAIIIVF